VSKRIGFRKVTKFERIIKMRRPAVKTIVLAISTVFVVALFYGCKEQTPEDTKSILRKSRLIATENMQLKKELATSQEKIEKLKGQIEEHQERVKRLEEAVRKSSEELVETVFMGLAEDSLELTAENTALKAEIEELKKELEALKQPHP
jgi:peptidoglycan hydrolase CwlO-like protein